MIRERWLNLNGTWQFEIDLGDSGLERGLLDRELGSRILVPFAPESTASGIGCSDFLAAVWYRRTIDIPAEWSGQKTILHFGAVDHDATVWVDGVEVARHRGGFTPFSADLGLRAGQRVTVVVRARDSNTGIQARGKQSTLYANAGPQYTRTTGIWQTVWLEAVPSVSLGRPRITPLLASRSFDVTVPVTPQADAAHLQVSVADSRGLIATAECPAGLDFMPSARVQLPAARARLWSPQDPHLFDITIELLDPAGVVVDAVQSYAGLRSVAIDGQRMLLNGEPVFQRLVLDQGFYPDTLMTAPDDAGLIADIELSLAAGFNGARPHQKVFEERFLFHADRLGYLVWGEFGDWVNLPGLEPGHDASFTTQWLEVLQRDYNHPSIVGWCPLNETVQPLDDRLHALDDVTRGMFLATKLADPTRPVLDTSGHSHRVTESDVYDSHNYEQDPTVFGQMMAALAQGAPFTNGSDLGLRGLSVPYAGQPYWCSEFGGIWWEPGAAEADGADREASWGYGVRPLTEEDFHRRFQGLVDLLLDNPQMFGYCYTQLTDVFQEKNGIYRFDRSRKLDVGRIRAAQERTAAIEQTPPV